MSAAGERVIRGPDCLAEGAAWLAVREARFAAVLPRLTPLPLRLKPEGFATLAGMIVSQQVSVASARAIRARLEAGGLLDAAAVRAAAVAELCGLGLSRPKARYLRALAEAEVDFAALRRMGSDAAVQVLTAVPGIGRWTAEIYVMFCLGRADVLAAGDLALQEGARMLFGLEHRPSERALRERAAAWSPWRSVAARALWAYYASQRTREGMS